MNSAQDRAGKSFPLAEAEDGARLTVLALRGGAGFQERISSMGLYIGCKADVLIGGDDGRMVLAVGDTRIALGHGMAQKVIVKRRGDER
ncbi:FeoA family protein [Kiritimatiella glycovorans]|uniref:FeoA domain protein n=1 Tax=Kiritimatiella glycovorans TaxID=1307763 RepID=A0A0G3EEW7_9BACT|nr:FeoA family protein [Kiritimatiella glycovorans]AKJ64853.1 FeoA domain protein [Kiritimatiella glycovorans]